MYKQTHISKSWKVHNMIPPQAMKYIAPVKKEHVDPQTPQGFAAQIVPAYTSQGKMLVKSEVVQYIKCPVHPQVVQSDSVIN